MNLTQKKLEEAVQANIITLAQAEKLTALAKENSANTPRFDFTHVLYYLGGMIAIGAMTLFMNLGWESFGGMGLFLSPSYMQV